jgi:hypothetical protein
MSLGERELPKNSAVFDPLARAAWGQGPKVTRLLLAVIVAPILFVYLLLAIAFGFLFVGVPRMIASAHFVRQMRKANRFVAWGDARSRLEQNDGTLICEFLANGHGCRYWWTPDDIAAISPFPFPHSSDEIQTKSDERFADFYKWCYKRYANPKTGMAYLVGDRKEDFQKFHEEIENLGYVTIGDGRVEQA